MQRLLQRTFNGAQTMSGRTPLKRLISTTDFELFKDQLRDKGSLAETQHSIAFLKRHTQDLLDLETELKLSHQLTNKKSSGEIDQADLMDSSTAFGKALIMQDKLEVDNLKSKIDQSLKKAKHDLDKLTLLNHELPTSLTDSNSVSHREIFKDFESLLLSLTDLFDKKNERSKAYLFNDSNDTNEFVRSISPLAIWQLVKRSTMHANQGSGQFVKQTLNEFLSDTDSKITMNLLYVFLINIREKIFDTRSKQSSFDRLSFEFDYIFRNIDEVIDLLQNNFNREDVIDLTNWEKTDASKITFGPIKPHIPTYSKTIAKLYATVYREANKSDHDKLASDTIKFKFSS